VRRQNVPLQKNILSPGAATAAQQRPPCRPKADFLRSLRSFAAKGFLKNSFLSLVASNKKTPPKRSGGGIPPAKFSFLRPGF